MITSEKLAVYREFGGDEDGWQWAGCPKRDLIDDDDWVAIRNLIQELTMLKRNLVSAKYGKQIRRRLSDLTADQDTARALLEMV